jgi:SAM-dependent methyltransferase
MNTQTSFSLFDRVLMRRHIARARSQFHEHSALFDDTAAQIKERLGDVKRRFPCALDASPFPFLTPENKASFIVSLREIALDEELLPFAAESFDLIASNLGLHWVNDVPGALAQIRTALKPEGLFIASLIGEQSLYELRACLLDAELAVCGGVSPRLSPTIDLQTASTLLHRAGFGIPVADMETVTLIYADMFALMRDLRGMGQTNAHSQRRRSLTPCAVFTEAERLYRERFGNAEGHIPATFDIIYLHGWKELLT